MAMTVITATYISLRAWVTRALVVQGLLLWALGTPAWGETVQSLSRPSRSTWVVDRTGALEDETRVELDHLGSEVERSGLGQLVVVMVATTEGRPPRTFATELFNRWGIGHSRRNDGVLLFIALLDRKAEIILGDGVDTPPDVARSQELMRERIIPALRKGETDDAVLEGARGLRTLLARAPINEGLAQAVVGPEVPVASEPVKPRAKDSRPQVPERKEFLDDEGMYVDIQASESSEEQGAPVSAAKVEEPSPSMKPPPQSGSVSSVSGQSSTSPWVWAVVGGFILLLIVANVLRRRSVACERCGSTSVKVSTSTLLAATEGSGGLVEVTVRCRRCGHVGTSTREVSARGHSHSHGGSRGGGHSSGRGSSGSW